MARAWKFIMVGGIFVSATFLLSGCAPGNERFYSQPAGFWAGLWHGFICIFTFIISLFTRDVRMYETSNAGAWYDFGFLLGAAVLLGGCCRRAKKRWRGRQGLSDRDWEQFGNKVEEKVRKGVRHWLEESEYKESDWADIEEKLEDKIKRELRDWADR
jgi:hypothetical protein